ncbi:MAG: hypothetical protein WD397_15580 [Wenzhouxiangellaceae bacterium]
MLSTRFRTTPVHAFARIAIAAAIAIAGMALPALASAQPAFSKSFNPATIGPGSASELVFVIDNSAGGIQVTDLAFTDNLPAGVTLADPAAPGTDCGAATLTAPDGGGTITFTDGSIAAGATCTVSVLVTSSTVSTHMNVSGDLTSSAGNSGTATADLAVATDRPGFSKCFSPSSGPLGSRSTLTFTIDNSANGSSASNLTFSDSLPSGLVVADPANALTTCTGGILTASPGSSTVSYGAAFFGDASIGAGAACTVSVDVVPNVIGFLDNVSSDLSSIVDSASRSSGRAVDTLESTAGDIVLIKEFLADPVPPGGTVDLEFTILNRTRSADATEVNFTDDLDATLTGLVATGVPASACGGTVSGTSTLSFSGGTVAAASECSFTVTLQVPAGATPANYPNTTDNIEADLGFGEPSFGNAATDDLFVSSAPLFSKEFIDDPVGAGGQVTLRFTIVNPSTTSAATDIAFTDDLNSAIPGLAANSLVALSGTEPDPLVDPCGSGSELTLEDPNDDLPSPPFPTFPPDPTQLVFTGGRLEPAGTPGDVCTFDVVLDVPADAPSGIYTNTSSPVTATVDAETLTGSPASDDLVVVAAPRLTKSFTDDPVRPGDTVTLQFTLTHGAEETSDATGIAFTDDLGITLSGLAATGLPLSDVCGPGSSISGTDQLSFTGGSLSPGESCTFSVTLQVPAGAPLGSFTNTTSEIGATVGGLATTGPEASDDLIITEFSFTKTFIDSPVIAGDTTTLRFTIENNSTTFALTDMAFTDNLDAMLSGAAAVGLPAADICGAGSNISGTGNLTFTGGNLGPNSSCTFDVTVQIPAATADDQYSNITSTLSGTFDGNAVTVPAASAGLEVNSSLLLLSKSFTDDPVVPGGSVTLEFTITNTSSTETVTGIAFSDDLDTALSGMAATVVPANGFCGAGSQATGGGVLTVTGASLAPSASCTFQVTVQVPAGAADTTVVNTTSQVSGTVGALAVQGPAASDELILIQVAFSKAFAGPAAAAGSVELQFVIDNLSDTESLSGVAFLDDLDAVIPGLIAANTPLAGVCGAGSELTGSSVLTLTGGNVPAGESCAFSVLLNIPASAVPGSFTNTTSNLTSGGLFLAGPASASLSIQPPPGFGKVFAPNAIAIDGTSTLTFTIDNSGSTLAADSLTFTDNLPAGIEVADPANAASSCGGTVTANAGSGNIDFSGGSVAAGSQCTVQVDITGTAEGTFVNVTEALLSSNGGGGTATDSIDVVAEDFVLTKSFRTEPVLPGGLVEMELSIVNGSDFALTDIALTDDLDAALAGLAAEGLPIADVCGAGSQISGTSTVTLNGGNLPAGGSCTVVVPVRLPADAPTGTFTNTTSVATGTREGVTVEAAPDTADLIVEPLAFTKTFGPAIVAAGSTTTATFEIVNPDPANAVSGLAFTDDLEAFVPGMTAANTPINDACGAGSLVDGTSTIAFSDGTLAAGGSCSFQVVLNVPTGTAAGEFINTTSTLTSTVGDTQTSAAAASGTLGIEPPPTFAKAFSPTTIAPGETSTLTFTIDNNASQLDADSLAFDDNLPAGVAVAAAPAVTNTCGGTLTADAGIGLIGLTGGSVTQGATCQIQVDITSNASGTFTNVSGDLTSSQGNSGNATATLTVSQAIPVPLFNATWLALLTLLLAAFGWQALITQKP